MSDLTSFVLFRPGLTCAIPEKVWSLGKDPIGAELTLGPKQKGSYKSLPNSKARSILEMNRWDNLTKELQGEMKVVGSMREDLETFCHIDRVR